jgi:hypothetical protein
VRNRGLVVRVLIGLGLMCAAVIALASSIVLHGAAVLVVLLAAAVAAFVAHNAAADTRAARPVDAAYKAAAGTVVLILLVVGVGVLAGGAVAAVVSGLAVVGGVVWLLKARRGRRAGARGPVTAATEDGAPAPMLPVVMQLFWQLPVGLIPTSTLGTEWLETTSALGRPVEPAVRQDIIRRREETLDELERRDPAGFARWLAAGAASDSDPATFVRGERSTGRDAA